MSGLEEYVRDLLKKGYDEEAVKHNLISYGYNPKDIDVAFEKIHPKSSPNILVIVAGIMLVLIVIMAAVMVFVPSEETQEEIVIPQQPAASPKVPKKEPEPIEQEPINLPPVIEQGIDLDENITEDTGLGINISLDCTEDDNMISCETPDLYPYEQLKVDISSAEPLICSVGIDRDRLSEIVKALIYDNLVESPLNKSKESTEFSFTINPPNIYLADIRDLRVIVRCIDGKEDERKISIKIKTKQPDKALFPIVFDTFPEPTSIEAGNNEIMLKVSMPMKQCGYSFSSGQDVKYLANCSQYSSTATYDFDSANPLLRMYESEIVSLMYMKTYYDIIESDLAFKNHWMEGKYTTDKSYMGYYPCYLNIDIPAYASELCIACESKEGRIGKEKQCFDLV